MKKSIAALSLLAVAGAALAAHDPQVTVANVAWPTTAAYNGSLSKLTDGVFNGASAPWGWSNANTVNWTTTGNSARVAMTFDKVYTLTGIALSASGNDKYKILYSADNTTWSDLMTFTLGGNNQMKTASSNGVGIGTRTPALNFTSVDAKYVRIFSVGTAATGSYSLGEVQFFGTAAVVPEPTSTALFLAGLGAMGLLSRRRKSQG